VLRWTGGGVLREKGEKKRDRKNKRFILGYRVGGKKTLYVMNADRDQKGWKKQEGRSQPDLAWGIKARHELGFLPAWEKGGEWP